MKLGTLVYGNLITATFSGWFFFIVVQAPVVCNSWLFMKAHLFFHLSKSATDCILLSFKSTYITCSGEWLRDTFWWTIHVRMWLFRWRDMNNWNLLKLLYTSTPRPLHLEKVKYRYICERMHPNIFHDFCQSWDQNYFKVSYSRSCPVNMLRSYMPFRINSWLTGPLQEGRHSRVVWGNVLPSVVACPISPISPAWGMPT